MIAGAKVEPELASYIQQRGENRLLIVNIESTPESRSPGERGQAS